MKYDYFKFKETVKKHDGNISHIAEDLGKTRVTVYNWIDRLKRDDEFLKRACKESK